MLAAGQYIIKEQIHQLEQVLLTANMCYAYNKYVQKTFRTTLYLLGSSKDMTMRNSV